MPDPTPSNGRMAAPPTPLNNRPVNRAARTVLEEMRIALDPSRLHLQRLLVEALELHDPGPGVPEAEWPDLQLALSPLLGWTPREALDWWTSLPELTQQEQEDDLAADLRQAENPQEAMWALLDRSRAILREKNSPPT